MPGPPLASEPRRSPKPTAVARRAEVYSSSAQIFVPPALEIKLLSAIGAGRNLYQNASIRQPNSTALE
jgi:hypothetical protein